MKHVIAFSMIGFIVAAISGCIFDPDDDNSNHGKKGSVSGTVKMTITGEPIANVKVYLVNRNAKIDTVNFTDNRAAFIDSAVTDAAGKYTIGSVASGDYGVVPAIGDTASAYKFSLSSGPGSNVFSLNGETRTVDFIAEKLMDPGADTGWFFFSIYLKKNDQYQYGDVFLEQKVTALHLTCWCNRVRLSRQTYVPEYPEADSCINCFWQRGYATDCACLENAFRVTVIYYTPGSDIERRKEFFFGFPLDHTPERSYFMVDVAAGTMEQIDEK